MQRSAIAAAFLLLPISLYAQWLHVKTPGIPRTAGGKPNLTAPAPRTPDGKPDLSGLWLTAPNSYWLDIIQDIKDEAIFTPRAQAVFSTRSAQYTVDSPGALCLPLGPGDSFASGSRIFQTPTEIAMLRETYTGNDYREIFMDGRELPKDPNPTWRGYSVGRWEGDTLVVETAGFNDVGWLDQVGHPRSEKLHVTEKFRRVDFGHIDSQITFEDPEMLTRPLTISLAMTYLADTTMDELVCNENEKDRVHSVTGQIKPEIQLSGAALAKYAGTYEPGNLIISLVNNQLYEKDVPIFPKSETVFDSRISLLVFHLDANGAVTGVDLVGAAGAEQRLIRKR